MPYYSATQNRTSRVCKTAVLRFGPIALAAIVLIGLLAGSASAQDGESKAPKLEVPDPEDITLTTTDNLVLHATYYPSPLGKEAVPVILVHMWKGDRRDYRQLAKYLQSQGHAVVVPDLRGHGDSTSFEEPEGGLPGRRVRSRNQTLDATTGRLPAQEFNRMVTHDMETVKKFLMKENNSAKLNIEKLCVVGAEMGAVVALNWAAVDWSWPPLATGKQGQDVKALVLLSPTWSFRNLQANEALTVDPVRARLSVMILVGKQDSGDLREARRFYRMMERDRPALDDLDQKERAEKQDLFYGALNTSLQGTKMLEDEGLEKKIMSYIGIFIKRRLVDQDFPWTDRSRRFN
jgi:pimeloyl-ACP methyl ester carboxylesterase